MDKRWFLRHDTPMNALPLAEEVKPIPIRRDAGVVGRLAFSGRMLGDLQLRLRLQLDAGAFTQGSLGLLACQLALNTSSAELVGLAGTGIEYAPFG